MIIKLGRSGGFSWLSPLDPRPSYEAREQTGVHCQKAIPLYGNINFKSSDDHHDIVDLGQTEEGCRDTLLEQVNEIIMCDVTIMELFFEFWALCSDRNQEELAIEGWNVVGNNDVDWLAWDWCCIRL